MAGTLRHYGYGAKLRKERRKFASEQTKPKIQGEATSVITPDPQRVANRSIPPFLPESKERGQLGKIMEAAPTGIKATYERMPAEERPIELIRGTERTYWSPGTKQEYGDLRTAMTGFQQRPKAERSDAGMTPYQKATLELGGKELGFKQNQAELDYITTGLEKRFKSMIGIGQQPTQNQTISETGKVRNEWIRTNYSPKEAKSLISRIPVELRKNEKTGKTRWYNEYGKPIKAETTAKTTKVDTIPPLPSVPMPTVDTGATQQPLSAEKLYSEQKARDHKYAIRRGLSSTIDTGKKVYENWLLRKNPQLDYPFNRSTMGR